MTRLNLFFTLMLVVASATAFITPSRGVVGYTARPSPPLFAEEKERGVSVDQDGKSNVWAIEPKVEVDTKSTQDNLKGIAIAVVGLAVLGAAATQILSNLPDPDQF